jgi:serine/threonine protein kinase
VENGKNFYIIMEYASGGELFNFIVKKRRLDESEASFFLMQIFQALEYIHKNGIVHRDLKPENLLLNEKKQLKVIDFGLSNQYKQGQLLQTPCGSPCYAAPEMILGRKYSGLMVDIWSCGIILYAMVCGYLPFEDKNNDKLYKKILECKLEFPSFLSSTCVDLIKRILTVNPNKRIKIDEIKQHPFMKLGEINSQILRSESTQSIDHGSKNKIAEIVLQKMAELGFDKTDIIFNLDNNKHNNITTTYDLLANKLRLGEMLENDEKDSIPIPTNSKQNININIQYTNKFENINININKGDSGKELEKFLKENNEENVIKVINKTNELVEKDDVIFCKSISKQDNEDKQVSEFEETQPIDGDKPMTKEELESSPSKIETKEERLDEKSSILNKGKENTNKAISNSKINPLIEQLTQTTRRGSNIVSKMGKFQAASKAKTKGDKLSNSYKYSIDRENIGNNHNSNQSLTLDIQNFLSNNKDNYILTPNTLTPVNRITDKMILSKEINLNATPNSNTTFYKKINTSISYDLESSRVGDNNINSSRLNSGNLNTINLNSVYNSKNNDSFSERKKNFLAQNLHKFSYSVVNNDSSGGNYKRSHSSTNEEKYKHDYRTIAPVNNVMIDLEQSNRITTTSVNRKNEMDVINEDIELNKLGKVKSLNLSKIESK